MNPSSSAAIRWSVGVVCFLCAVGTVVFACRAWPIDFLWGVPNAILLVVTVAFFRAGYLALFRWSPLAIRHLVGALFFLITIGLIVANRKPVHSLFILITCYVTYRFVAYQVSRYAFPLRKA